MIELMEYCLKNYKDGEPNKELLTQIDDVEDRGTFDFEAVKIIE